MPLLMLMDRQHEAVELVIESSAARFAIEHTRIESRHDRWEPPQHWTA